MIDLGLNQYKIKEIKYEIKEGKTVIFKFNNYNLEDVEVIEEKNEKSCTDEKLDDFKKMLNADAPSTDRQMINEYLSVEEKRQKKQSELIDYDKCKNLIDKTKDIPYKAIEKIGSMNIFPKDKGGNDVEFYPEPDPYVVNDERELPRQKKPGKLNTDVDTEKEN